MSIQYNFNRFAHSYNEYAIVQAEIASRMMQRLQLIDLGSAPILELGAGTGILTQKLIEAYGAERIIASDFATEPLLLNPANHTFVQDAHDLQLEERYEVILSNVMMQWCDLAKVCQNVKRISAPNALFFFTTFGPATLGELRHSWAQVDTHTHVNSFIDMHTIADTLSQHGFGGVVAESEIITLTYEHVRDILKDLKYIGAQNPTATPTTKSKLTQMISHYEQFRTQGKLPLTYEVVYIHGWSAKSSHTSDIPLNNE